MVLCFAHAFHVEHLSSQFNQKYADIARIDPADSWSLRKVGGLYIIKLFLGLMRKRSQYVIVKIVWDFDMIQTIMMIIIIFKIDMAVEAPKALWWKIFSSWNIDVTFEKQIQFEFYSLQQNLKIQIFHFRV